MKDPNSAPSQKTHGQSKWPIRPSAPIRAHRIRAANSRNGSHSHERHATLSPTTPVTRRITGVRLRLPRVFPTSRRPVIHPRKRIRLTLINQREVFVGFRFSHQLLTNARTRHKQQVHMLKPYIKYSHKAANLCLDISFQSKVNFHPVKR